MSVELECIGCRNVKQFEQEELYPVCLSCREWEKKHIEELNASIGVDSTCTQCGYEGAATDLHHIHGRKNSNEVIRVCCNCHAEIHRGARELVL